MTHDDTANAQGKCLGYVLEAMREIVRLEPGSKGAYQKFAQAQRVAKESIEYCTKHLGPGYRDAE